MREELPGVGRILARLLPSDVVRRMFGPAYLDLYEEHTAQRRGARSRATFAARAILMVVECAARAAIERQPRRFVPTGTRRGLDPMIVQDLRFAVRMLRKNRAFTVVAVLALAIGIGASTVMFSVVRAVLLQPLPYADPDRVVSVTEAKRGSRTTVAPPNFVDWAAQNHTFARLVAYNEGTATLSGNGDPERLDAASVGADFLDVLGVRPVAGRGFLPDEARPGGTPAVILGHALWQRRYGSDPSVIGRTISVDSAPHTIVGVMPAGFNFAGADLWVPLVLTDRDTNANQRGAHYLSVVGRLATGASLEQATADLNRIEQAIATEFPNKVAGYTVTVDPLLDSIVGDLRRPLWMLLGAVVFVLLIACANVSNLLLARATTRRAEIALRAALGAGRWRIVRQLLAESVTLALVGGAAGLLIAEWAVHGLGAVLPLDLPRGADISIDGRVLFFSILASATAGIVFGLAPALYASSADLSASLKDRRRDGAASGGRGGLRGAVVALEVALALILLTGAGLSLRSFDRLNRISPGFNASGTLSVNVALPEARYPDAQSAVRFYQQFQDRLEAQPGVTSAGLVMMAPLVTSGGFGGSFSILGRTPEEAPESMQVRPATPGYFETLRIPLRRGRLFTKADKTGAPAVAVISEDAARRFWPQGNAIGQRIRIHVGIYGHDGEREIVGVVGDVKTGALAASPKPVVYVPHAQYPSDVMTLFVRGAGDPMALVPTVRSELAAIDRDVAPTDIRPADALVSSAVAEPRFRLILLGVFAVLALALAAVGLYGVVAFSVNQRRNELGLRIALGAARGEVLRLVLLQGLAPVGIGMVCGLAGAAALTRVMSGLLYETPTNDPVTFLAVAATLGTVAGVACFIPARRATAVDPIVAMRSE